MRSLLLVVSLFLGFFFQQVDAQTLTVKYRSPLNYGPTPINAFIDHDQSSTNTNDTRFDGKAILSQNYCSSQWGCFNYYYDDHKGIDFGATYGTPVYLAANGYVEYTNSSCAVNGGYLGNTCGYGFGNYVVVNHADGMRSIYGHLSSVAVSVSSSTLRTCSLQLGLSGNSGSSSGQHLHFELRYGSFSSTAQRYDPWKSSISSGYVSANSSGDLWQAWTFLDDPFVSGTDSSLLYPVGVCQ